MMEINRQELISKLFEDEIKLTSEEIVLISKCLAESKDESLNKDSLAPYDHSAKNVFEACGINEQVHETFGQILLDSHQRKDRISEVIEDLSSLVKSDELFTRFILGMACKFIVAQSEMRDIKSKLGDLKDRLIEEKSSDDDDDDDE